MTKLSSPTTRVAILFVVGAAIALLAMSGPAVGVYSYDRHTNTATATGISQVDAGTYHVAGGPTSSAHYSAGPLSQSGSGSPSTGKVKFATRTTKANASFESSKAIATVTGFNLLSGKVTFDKVIAISHSSSHDPVNQSDSTGSSIGGLTVNGQAKPSTPGKTYPVLNNGQKIAHIDVLKFTKTQKFGVTNLTIVGVKITFDVAFQGFSKGYVILVAKSTSQSLCCGMAP